MTYNNPNDDPYSLPSFDGSNMPNGHYFPGQQDDLGDYGLNLPWSSDTPVVDPRLSQTNLSDGWQQQQHYQQPMDRFLIEPQRNLFTAEQLPSKHFDFPRRQNTNDGIASLPKAAPHSRYVSPAPSLGMTSSVPTSAQSPSADQDWQYDGYAAYSPYLAPRDSLPHSSHEPMGHHCASSFPEQNYYQPVGFSNNAPSPCVSMDQVQSFQDIGEASFDDPDRYHDAPQQFVDSYSGEMDLRAPLTHQTSHQQSYRHSSDEGLGESVKSVGDPAAYNTPPAHETSSVRQDPVYPEIEGDGDVDADADADADPDADAEETEENTAEVSDEEYTPRSSRTRKRRVSNSYPIATPPAKRARATGKSQLKKAGSYVCKDCTHAPFKDTTSLQKHVNQAHIRAFTCVFAFAGCKANFASKNEWKRHVSSQHLNLSAWICKQGSCGKPHANKKSGEKRNGVEFNRKDLFTQHIRRMHSPAEVKRKNTKNAEWEETLKKLQIDCLIVKREAPRFLGCPMYGCIHEFTGPASWDERMEHVGKHLEQAARAAKGTVAELRQEDDRYFVEWAEREGIIERRLGGSYGLVGLTISDGEADADGEDE